MKKYFIGISGWIIFGMYLIYDAQKYHDVLLQHLLSLDEPLTAIFHFIVIVSPLMSTYTAYLISQKDKYLKAAINEKTKTESIIDGIGDGISIQDPDFNVLYQNKAHIKMIGEHTGEKCYKAYEKQDEICEGCPIALTFQDGQVHTVERSAVTDKGMLYVEIKTSPIKDADGNIVAGVEVARNITERKINEEKLDQALKEKEVLLHEIHHRVKNNMQIILSMIRLQMHEIKDDALAGFLLETQDRIRAMALVQDYLYKSERISEIDFKPYVNSLIKGLKAAFSHKQNISIHAEIDEIDISVSKAVPAGLILNELITNAFKHAFDGSRGGEILVLARQTNKQKEALDSGENVLIELIVRDNGAGLPEDIEPGKTKSLGLNLVHSLIQSQLKGTLDVIRGQGTEFRIKFSSETK